MSSCEEDSIVKNRQSRDVDKDQEIQSRSTDYSGFDLSYDVEIFNTVSFQNGIDEDSDGWKKLESYPSSQSYSMDASMNNGVLEFEMDNIQSNSPLDMMNIVTEKTQKLSLKNGVVTSTLAGGEVNSMAYNDDLSSMTDLNSVLSVVNGFNVQDMIDGASRHLMGVNTLMLFYSIADGNSSNEVISVDPVSGLPKAIVVYNDTDPNQMEGSSFFKFDPQGNLENIVYTYYDYLSDGDVKKETISLNFSNFSLTYK